MTIEAEKVGDLKNKVRRNHVKFARLKRDLHLYSIEQQCYEQLLDEFEIHHPTFSRFSEKFHENTGHDYGHDADDLIEDEEQELLDDWLAQSKTLNEEIVTNQFQDCLRASRVSQDLKKSRLMQHLHTLGKMSHIEFDFPLLKSEEIEKNENEKEEKNQLIIRPPQNVYNHRPKADTEFNISEDDNDLTSYDQFLKWKKKT